MKCDRDNHHRVQADRTETKSYPIDDAAVETRAVASTFVYGEPNRLMRGGFSTYSLPPSASHVNSHGDATHLHLERTPRHHPECLERGRRLWERVFAYRATPQKRKHTLPARTSGHYTPVRPAPKRQKNSSNNNTRTSAYYPHPRSSRETTRPRKKKASSLHVRAPAPARATLFLRGQKTHQKRLALVHPGPHIPPLASATPRALPSTNAPRGRRGRPIDPQDAYGGEQTSWISAFSRCASISLRGGKEGSGCGGLWERRRGGEGKGGGAITGWGRDSAECGRGGGGGEEKGHDAAKYEKRVARPPRMGQLQGEGGYKEIRRWGAGARRGGSGATVEERKGERGPARHVTARQCMRAISPDEEEETRRNQKDAPIRLHENFPPVELVLAKVDPSKYAGTSSPRARR
ncbi:hypothetical protein B0H16DRAFT_1774828 [Mycena metata]|uniref:Uncharacterized protein n=1 Tax=Mycena metata TaxID=1033252 RepID=A0AAD7JS39_9AGAR|nr:hypothetical protein B0H16DRAFT_1774828 [Mycena metata]